MKFRFAWTILGLFTFVTTAARSETLSYHGINLEQLGIYKSGALPPNPGGFLFGFTSPTGGRQYPDGLPGNTFLFSPINVIDWSDGTNDASGNKAPGVHGITAETFLIRLTYFLPDFFQPENRHIRLFSDIIVPYTHIGIDLGYKAPGLTKGNLGDIYWTPLGALFTGLEGPPIGISSFIAVYFGFPSGAYSQTQPLNIGNNEYFTTLYTNECITLYNLNNLFLNIQMHYTHILQSNNNFSIAGSKSLTDLITGSSTASYNNGDIFDFNLDVLYPFTQRLVGGASFSVMRQISDDKLNGLTILNSGQSALAVGGSIQYALPYGLLQLKYLRSLQARNMPAYNSFVVNTLFPF
jgi:hypothetical protein